MNWLKHFSFARPKDTVTVEQDVLRQYPYYGLRGFLLFIYIFTALFEIFGVIAALFPTETDVIRDYGNNVLLTRFVYFWSVLVTLPFLLLAPLKHRLTPSLWIAGLWASWIVFVVALDMPEEDGTESFVYLFTTAYTIALTRYILASKRVNATFLGRVPTAYGSKTFKELQGGELAARKTPRWFVFVAGGVGAIVLIGFFGLLTLGLYETTKRTRGTPLLSGVRIFDDQQRYSLRTAGDGWVQVPRGTIEEGASMEFYGPTVDTWAVVYTYGPGESELDQLVASRRNTIGQAAEKFTAVETRVFLPDSLTPVSYAKYKDLDPVIPPPATWWVTTVKTESIGIEVIASTTDRNALDSIEEFARSLLLNDSPEVR